MITTVDITLSPKNASHEKFYIPALARKLNIDIRQIYDSRIVRKSIDARSRNIKVTLKIMVALDEPRLRLETPKFDYPQVKNKPEVVVVGMGPAGLFAALRLIELGYKPIIIERGKEVSTRKVDIAAISTKHIIDPDSNYCFGEGGAGTFSDGKLFTRSKKKGSTEKILQLFNFHGADESILFDAHPHIGTNKLPAIIKNIRETILNAGGEIYFGKKVVDLQIENNCLKAVVCSNGDIIPTKALILATGHSARDVYEMLHTKGILLEPKSFAVGVRVEHPQELIDIIQYHGSRGEFLPAAEYSLVRQVKGRGVYSFCMCPGGFIVPAATAPGELVVNGMSADKRNSPFANSGIVVEIRPEDLKEYSEFGPLAGMKYQLNLERLAFINGGSKQTAPAQRLHDFVNGRISASLPDTSYFPGVVSSPLHHWMPELISSHLQEGFRQFGKILHGYLTNEAIILGVESRTSSPVRIPRDTETLQHPQIKALFPCGEGAGYAGGIVSSAIDGERCAEMAVEFLKNNK